MREKVFKALVVEDHSPPPVPEVGRREEGKKSTIQAQIDADGAKVGAVVSDGDLLRR